MKGAEMKCESCVNYSFYQMIQQPYGYTGVIPCLSCEEWLKPLNNYKPALQEKPKEEQYCECDRTSDRRRNYEKNKKGEIRICPACRS